MILLVADDGCQRSGDGEALLELGVLKEDVHAIVVSTRVSLPECDMHLNRLSRREIGVTLEARREPAGR